MGFASEREMMRTVLLSPQIAALVDPVFQGSVFQTTEPKGLWGVPDVLLATFDPSTDDALASTVAIELKLSKWRRALMQAYRYRAFANMSWVVMDRSHLGPAQANIEMFERSNVGLASVDDDGTIEILFRPSSRQPYSPQLSEVCRQQVVSQSVRCAVPLILCRMGSSWLWSES